MISGTVHLSQGHAHQIEMIVLMIVLNSGKDQKQNLDLARHCVKSEYQDPVMIFFCLLLVPEEVRPLNFIVILSFSGYWLIFIINWSLVESFKCFSLTNFSVMGAAVDLGSVRAFLFAMLNLYSDSYISSNYIEWSLGRPQPPLQK